MPGNGSLHFDCQKCNYETTADDRNICEKNEGGI